MVAWAQLGAIPHWGREVKMGILDLAPDSLQKKVRRSLYIFYAAQGPTTVPGINIVSVV